ALLQGEEAISAWEKWKVVVDFEQLDPGSHNLLPLLYNNLGTLGIKDPLMKKLKGIYRQTWYKNQLSIHRLGSLLNYFHRLGIETMVLKGAALTPLYYRNHGLRPMSDIDVLVPSKKASEAINALIESGWTPESQSPESQIPVAHGTEFRSTSGQIIDLHWHVLHECRRVEVDDRFWRRAIIIKLNNVSTHALSPTDQLLHILVHGIKWNPDPPFRWVADAMTIINAAQSEIDWDTLSREAKEYRLILPVRLGLGYLRSKFNASIPQAILETIQNTPASKMERIEHSYKTGNYLRKPLGYMPILWFDYSRLEGNKALLLKLAGFPEYLRLFWGAESFWQLPRHAISMTARKIRSIKDYYWGQ
ncbi:MAG: nucleotidyltransferase domain-containing protein, partial [Thermodesulfobacteriota bacterium]